MSNDPYFGLDAYTIKARLRPVAIVALPLAVGGWVWLMEEFPILSVLWGILIWCGGTYLASELGRDLGRNKQPGLYESWGGPPTTSLLRHRDAKNRVLLVRWHKKLQELLGDIEIPTEEEERKNPKHADEVYETCASYLREHTRDKEKFALVFDENCSYGFRRNLWGMRKIGIVLSAIGTAAILVYIGVDFLAKAPVPKTAIVAGILNLAILTSWIFLFDSRWVKTAADAYALRLIESSEKL